MRFAMVTGLLLLGALAAATVIVPRSPQAPAAALAGSDANGRASVFPAAVPAEPERSPEPASSMPSPASSTPAPQADDAMIAALSSPAPLQAARQDEFRIPYVAASPTTKALARPACSPAQESDMAWQTRPLATTCTTAAVIGLLATTGDSRTGTDLASLATPTATAAAAVASGQPVAATVSAQVLPLATAPAIQTAHPRMLLDSATLTNLRAAASANTAEWQALKATCDSYIGGQVYYPTGNQYPDLPNLGSGYQGESYLPALLAEGMCYQVLKGSNANAAAPYGAKAVDILVKMSTPFTTGSGNQGQDPCTDDGYGIRNFGVGYGLGYDWVYDLLTSAQRTQVYTTANAWITAWEKPNGCAAFAFEHPQSNYYAGYFHAKAAIAIGTYGDNPSAPAEWSDWYGNQFSQRVQPYYALHLAGGGWPEGYGNYAPLGILNMSLPAREVKTATGVDLVHASAPYRFPLDSADYAMHFTWPSRAYFDDRDTNHASGTATPPVGTTQVGMFQQILGALAFWGSPNVSVFHQYLNDVNTATSGFNTAAPWLLFLDGESALPTASVNSLPLSYLATGMNAVAARSDWTTSASWMSFRAGPYVNNPDQGEEGFDQGSLALVRGNTPLLVNATGWIVHEPNGSSDENLVYNDEYGSFNNTQYMGNRQPYNVYYVRSMSGSKVLERFGQDSNTTEDNHVSTKVAGYEDRDGYVFVQATGLADMYRTFAAGPAVASWTRQIVYLRPNQFVVYDRTTAGSASYDQYLAWHFPANPVAGSAATGQNRLNVTYNGTYAGAMTTVLPAGSSLTTVPLYPSSNPTKVWQIQERSPSSAVSQQWLTVFDLSASASAAASVAPVTISQGSMVGVQLTAGSGNSVVLQSAAPAGTAVTGTIAYSVPAANAHHVITELSPNTGYNVTATVSGGNLAISVSQGGTYMSSPAGVLDFFVSAGGTISLSPPVSLTAPISDLPVPGYPKPYKP